MQTSIPIWVAISVAILTGLFTLAAQALSGKIARKSQLQLLEAQDRNRRQERITEKAEEFFSLCTETHDNVHTPVVLYQFYKKGKTNPKSVVEAIEKPTSNENYKRMMTLYQLYFDDTAIKFKLWNDELIKCFDLLVEWSKNQQRDISNELEKSFEEASRRFGDLREEISSRLLR